MKKISFLLILIVFSFVFQMCTPEGNNPLSDATEPKLPNDVYNYSQLELPKVNNSFNSNVLSVFVNLSGDTLKIHGVSSNFESLILNGSLKFIREEQTQQVTFFNTVVTDKGATLGRVLFYDKALHR